MNGLMGQLPEWMRSPAALSVGGLVLLVVLVLVFRRRGGRSAHGLPSGRGWRSKVPLPNQASPLDAMRAALESSRKIEVRRRPDPLVEAPEVAPVAEAAPAAPEEVKRLLPGEASNADAAPEDAAPTAEAPADASDAADDVSEADSAKVVPLPVGLAGAEARDVEASTAEAPDTEASEDDAAPAREQKG